jgi:hypothetical protein
VRKFFYTVVNCSLVATGTTYPYMFVLSTDLTIVADEYFFDAVSSKVDYKQAKSLPRSTNLLLTDC